MELRRLTYTQEQGCQASCSELDSVLFELLAHSVQLMPVLKSHYYFRCTLSYVLVDLFNQQKFVISAFSYSS